MGVRAGETGHAHTVKREKPLGALVLNAALAGALFLIGVWFYFYIDRIPLSQRMIGEPVVAKPGTALVLGGLKAGPFLSINLKSGGRLELSIDKGANVVTPAASALAAAPPADEPAAAAGFPSSGAVRARTILNLYNSGTGNAGLDLELSGTGQMKAELVPVPTEDGRNGFQITPLGGTLVVNALVIPGNDGKVGAMTLMTAGRTTGWDEAKIEIPDGARALILAEDAADAAKRSTVIELPNYLSDYPVISGTLPAAFVAVGHPAGGDFSDFGDFSDIVCGARAPGEKVLKPLAFPEVRPSGCTSTIDVSALDPFGEIALEAWGAAFEVKDGKPTYWEGPSQLLANPLVAPAFKGAVVAPFLLWAGLAFKALWKGRRRPWRAAPKA